MKEQSSPELVNERLDQKNRSSISCKALNTFFTFIDYGREDCIVGYDLWRSKETGTLVFGHYATVGKELRFLPVVTITTHERLKRLKNLKSVIQVDTVSCGKKNALAGFAREAYLIASRHFDLVSDDTHSLGAIDLWKSLSGLQHSYVYVWYESDWVKDSEGQPLQYNGKNLSDSFIWGGSKILLVLRSKPLSI